MSTTGLTFHSNRYVDFKSVKLATLNASNGKDARMMLGFRDGMPRITVYTGEAGRGGVLNFPMDMVTGTVFMTMLQELAEHGKPGDRRVIDSKGFVYTNGQKVNDEMVVKATAHMGVSKSGILYLSISESAPEKQMENKLIFQIQLSEFHSVKDQNGEELDPSTASRKVAKAIAELMLGAIGDAMISKTREEFCHQSGSQYGKGMFDPVTKKMIPYQAAATTNSGASSSPSKPSSPPSSDDLDADFPF